ncbi:hypothetical protein IUU84_08225 [Kocuria rhizophila]|uniref:hypothetical protein n=1 Tax=Kocuria rhizophila TaxID=72000 RepID=UPI002949851B|nr:hypothetical protein [Kocuria rhizophila]MDV5999558.1 hypothetical protein [Kocuria rhizophila]
MRTVSASRNRTVLLLLGLLLLAGGIILGLIATGTAATIAGMNRWAPDSTASLGSLLGPAGQYLLIIGITATVIAAIFALWWLLHQIPTKAPTTAYRMSEDADHGTVTVEPAVLARAVEDQLEALPGVTGAHAELAGSARHPELLAALTLAPRIDVQWVLRQVYTTVITDLQTCLETGLEHVSLEIDTTRESAGSTKTSVRRAGPEPQEQQQPTLA